MDDRTGRRLCALPTWGRYDPRVVGFWYRQLMNRQYGVGRARVVPPSPGQHVDNPATRQPVWRMNRFDLFLGDRAKARPDAVSGICGFRYRELANSPLAGLIKFTGLNPGPGQDLENEAACRRGDVGDFPVGVPA